MASPLGALPRAHHCPGEGPELAEGPGTSGSLGLGEAAAALSPPSALPLRESRLALDFSALAAESSVFLGSGAKCIFPKHIDSTEPEFCNDLAAAGPA